MKIALKPKVYLVGKTMVDHVGLQAFLTENVLKWPTDMGDTSELLIEAAGRICYASYGSRSVSKSNFDYIQNLLGRNKDGTFKAGPAHGSVLEHAVFNFIIIGAGRGFSHELVRHRAGWAYSQISTRYVDFEQSDEIKSGDWEPTFCIPPMAQLNSETSKFFEETMIESQKIYGEAVQRIMRDLIKNQDFMKTLNDHGLSDREKTRIVRKAARGAARDLLVHATEAMIFTTANVRAIWNCTVLRASEHAEGVIRDVFVQIARIMEKEIPSVFYGLEYKKCWDGSECVIMPRDHI